MNGEQNECLTEEELDRRHFIKTVASFRFYKTHLLTKLKKKRKFYQSLSPDDKQLIPDFESRLNRISDCIEHNSQLLSRIMRQAAPDIFKSEHLTSLFANCSTTGDTNNDDIKGTTPLSSLFAFTNHDMDKVRSTVRQFVRDWSSAGVCERQACYQPVIDEVDRLFASHSSSDKSQIRILVPGAGLGRLAWELAHRGYSCQGNEFSLHMLLPSFFILNTCKKIDEFEFYPWVSQFNNTLSQSHQTASIRFPDACPADIPSNVEFSMAAGDFIEVYTEKADWDCVATVFFIDTAHNALTYLRTIWNILKPGGYWINLGPLLYHFSDVPNQDSLELTYEELQMAAKSIGFELISERTDIECGYTENPNSMLTYRYKCAFGVYRKPV